MFKQYRGILIRTPACDISVVGRNSEGARPIDLLEDERLVGMEGFEDYEQGKEFETVRADPARTRVHARETHA